MSTPLKYRLNPCDQERHGALAPIGDAFAAVYDAFTGDTDCPCCLGARLLAVVLASAGIGVLLSLLWS